MFTGMLSEATPVFLLSPWKPFFIFALFLGWGWLVSTHLEKDAQLRHLNPSQWNGYYAGAAIVGLGIMLFGVNFYIALPIGALVLFSPILAYWKIRNAAVPEEMQFHLGLDSIKESLEGRKRAKASRQVSIHFDRKGEKIEVPKKDNPQIEIYLLADEIIATAMDSRASRIELQLSSNGCQGAYFVDGIANKFETLSPDNGAKVLAFFKEAAGTDANDVRRRQTGEFSVSGEAGSAHLDLTASGSSRSHTIRLDFDRKESVLRDWDSIGLLPKQRELLNQLTRDSNRHGIVLIGGEKQSGVTTTGYAILSQHDSYLSNIVTLEKEVVAVLEGITHNADGDIDGDYATQLQTVIRRDPEVILATNVTDAEVAKVAVKVGNDGPLIYVSMPATSLQELVSKWAGMVADPKKSFENLQAIVYQKLARRLCENCRVAYKPSPDLAKQGLPIDTVDQLYRKGGQVEFKNKIITCPICNGSGYMGQVGIFATMFLDKETRKHLFAGDLKAAMAHARRNKSMIRLQESAWQKVADGETSLEEFGRVSNIKSTEKKTASK
ncbi:MAG: Flp pilus assembly complex ATPase component TadA [Phycisphaerae bacterium]|jgi:general secretion pathway protein E|nr:Flp pilus assembly complex ATPase component TadA [Phycisphaerae bacterium]MBT6282159.1 Flp pilus assembly complex ATPase component TadA [Phycisphaerae bacterium]